MGSPYPWWPWPEIDPLDLLTDHAYKALRVAWTSMALLALSTTCLPFVDHLADHGKIYTSRREGYYLGPRLLHFLLERPMVPKRLFWHFYAVGLVWNPVCLVGARHLGRAGLPVWCLGGLMQIHLLRRLYESLFVFQYGQSKMHIAGYLVGIANYILASLTLVADPWAEHSAFKPVDRAPLVLGVLLFVIGSIHQWRCHHILASLRSRPSPPGAKAPSSSSSSQAGAGPKPVYRLPRGDWFELVSSPHYYAEVLIYFSFVVITTAQNLTALAMLVWVVVNLAVTASKTHSWYRQTFDDYPRGRMIMFPFIW